MTCLEKEKWRERKGDMKEYDSKEKSAKGKNEEELKWRKKESIYKKKKSKTGKWMKNGK